VTETQKQWGLLIAAVSAAALYAAAASAIITAGLSGFAAAAVIAATGILWTALAAACLTVLNRAQSGLLAASAGLTILCAGWLQPAAIAAGSIAGMLIIAAGRRIKAEIHNRIRYRIRDVYYRPARLLLLAAALAAAAPALTALQEDIATDGLHVPGPTVAAAAKPVDSYLVAIFPGYQPQGTIADFVEAQLRQTGQTEPLTDSERRQLEAELSRKFGQPVSASMNIPDAVAQSVNGYLSRFSQQSPLLTALIIMLLAALAVRAALPFLAWPTVAGIWLCIAAALRWHIIYRIEEPRLVQRLTLTPPASGSEARTQHPA